MKYANLSIKTYLDKVAEKTPAPGGGSIAALFGASGCALMQMVLAYSKGKKSPVIKRANAIFKDYRRYFTRLIDEDAAVYAQLSSCYKRSGRNSSKTQAKLKKAALIPFGLCNKSYEAMRICSKLLNELNKNLLCDVGCAAAGFICAFKSAKFNVDVNIKYIKDRRFSDSIRKNLGILGKKILSLDKDVRKKTKKGDRINGRDTGWK